MNHDEIRAVSLGEYTELETIKGFAGWVWLPGGEFINLAIVVAVRPHEDGVELEVDGRMSKWLEGKDAKAITNYLRKEAVDITQAHHPTEASDDE